MKTLTYHINDKYLSTHNFKYLETKKSAYAQVNRFYCCKKCNFKIKIFEKLSYNIYITEVYKIGNICVYGADVVEHPFERYKTCNQIMMEQACE